MHHSDRSLAANFTLAAQLRPESTAIAATGLVAPDPHDPTGQWARTEPGELNVCARNLEAAADRRGRWSILTHHRYPDAILLETSAPQSSPAVDDVLDLPRNADLWPSGVVEHDRQAGTRYWIYTGPELEEGGWVATDAASAYFDDRQALLTSVGWEPAWLPGSAAAGPADQGAWAERWCTVASAEACLAVERSDLWAVRELRHLVPADDEVALQLWMWTAGWADEQRGYDPEAQGRKQAEANLVQLDVPLMRAYLRHAATAPAHIAMASAVGARLDQAPAADFNLLARLHERARQLWAVSGNAHDGYQRWAAWRTEVNARLDLLAAQHLHLAVDRHRHPGPVEDVITRPASSRHIVDQQGSGLRRSLDGPARSGSGRRGGGRSR